MVSKRILEKYLKPKAFSHGFMALDPSLLKENGIVLLVCDIDNTLMDSDQKQPDPSTVEKIREFQNQGIDLILMSNNFSRTSVSEQLGLPAYLFACKPFRFTFSKICREQQVAPEKAAIFGDQLLTDILGGKRAGFFTILNTKKAGSMRLDQKIVYWLESRLVPEIKNGEINE